MTKSLLQVARRTVAVAALICGATFGPALAQSDEATDEAGETAPAVADLPNNARFGDWIVACEAATVKRNVCRLEQEQTLRDSGQLVARFIAVPVSDGAILLAQTPMGTYLPGGAVYRFAGDDETEQREMIWQRCLGTICEAAGPLDTDELALFAEREALLFGFRMNADGDPIILSVDISQFTEALAALAAASGTTEAPAAAAE